MSDAHTRQITFLSSEVKTLIERVSALEQNGIPGVKDFFATSALSCLANSDLAKVWSPQDVAEFAYDVAEAMMEERKKRKEQYAVGAVA